MKSSVLQLLFVFFSHFAISLAVRHYDPLEEFLMKERLREEEFARQQQELRLRFEQQQLALLRAQAATGTDSDLLSTDVDLDASTTALDDGVTETTTTTTSLDDQKTTVSTRQREMQSTCCLQGARAARSGFLCNPENYRPEIFMRHEANRPGNFKIARVQQYVEVRQFRKCISGAVPWLSDEFQRCCKQAYVDALDETVVGVGDDDSGQPIMLELPLQIDISKQRKHPRTNHKTHVKV